MNKINWFPEELAAFKPPEKITVSEFADKYRILDTISNAEGGKWKTDTTPYLREIMDQFNNEDTEEVNLMTGSQIGKTECILNILLYIIAHDPGPVMYVCPDEGTGEQLSTTRVQPMIKAAPCARSKWRPNDSERLELRFKHDMYIYFAAASSAAQLASRPVRYVFMDEVDKYKEFSGKEANPIQLAQERTKTFLNKKIVKVSTPTTDDGYIYRAYEACDVQKHFYVPCPHCGHYQVLVLDQIKTNDKNNVKYSSWYECEECKGRIYDHHKPNMMKAGRWEEIYRVEGKKVISKVGYQISSIYSPKITFGDVLEKHFDAMERPSERQNFTNSWLAEPWQEQIAKVEKHMVWEKQVDYPKKYVPEEAYGITAGVDVQKDHLFYVVRAWGKNMTNWLVDYGRVETLQELRRKLLDTPYPIQNGKGNKFVDKICIDSGYKSEDIYNFCLYHYDVCLPTKGMSDQMKAERKYRVSSLDNKGKIGLKLYLLDTNRYKDQLFGTISMPVDEPGSWLVFDGVEEGYMDQITSEHKVKVKSKSGKVREAWTPYSSHANNHYLDCEVYALAAADIFDYRDINVIRQALEEVQQAKQEEHEQNQLDEVAKQEEEVKQPVEPIKKKQKKEQRRTSNWFRR